MNATRNTIVFGTIVLAVGILAACGSDDSSSDAGDASDTKRNFGALAGESFEEAFAEEMDMDTMDEMEAEAPGVVLAPEPFGTQAVFNIGGETLIGAFSASDRMIIKNADMTLLVEDTAVAINRLTQIVGDFGGYIISSREWFTDWYGDNYKNATYTFAVPVDQFERALGRLRSISIRVLDEQASGQDVTQEFVDLDSRLRNLEATRDRIRTFLDQAKTVEEALRVNQELSDIDDQIEQTKGRMNFLAGRAAYSTITVTLNPELPDFVPTPTFTPTATSTPTATPIPPTSTPWKPGETFTNASKTLGSAYRNIAELAIWLLVVVLPIFGPFVLVFWYFIARSNKRFRSAAKEKK